MTVRGSAGASDDAAALQQQRVLEQLAVRRKIPVSELQSAALLDDKANRKALENINADLQLPDLTRREETLKEADPELDGDALTRQAYRQMLAEVTAKQVIAQQDLLDLADRRALVIKQYLVETAGLDHNRVQLLKTSGDFLKGRVCTLGVEPE